MTTANQKPCLPECREECRCSADVQGPQCINPVLVHAPNCPNAEQAKAPEPKQAEEPIDYGALSLMGKIDALRAENAALVATIQSRNADYDEASADRDALAKKLAEIAVRLQVAGAPNQLDLDQGVLWLDVALETARAKLAAVESQNADLRQRLQVLESGHGTGINPKPQP